MAVYWFGWGNKVKNALTKKQADGLYLPKTFEAAINEVKRLTTLKVFTSSRNTISTGYYMGDDSDINGEIDFSRPVYIGFRKFNDASFTDYSYVVIFHTINYWFFLNENVSVRITNISAANNKVGIEFNIRNLTNTQKIGYPSCRYTLKTLTSKTNTTVRETYGKNN